MRPFPFAPRPQRTNAAMAWRSAALLVTLGLGMTLAGPAWGEGLRNIFQRSIDPAVSLVAEARLRLSRSSAEWGSTAAAAARVRELEARARALEAENRRWVAREAALGPVGSTTPFRVIPCRVWGSLAWSFTRRELALDLGTDPRTGSIDSGAWVLDAGTDRGVAAQSWVTIAHDVVGRVEGVRDHSARAVSITDRSFRAVVQIVRPEAGGIARGPRAVWHGMGGATAVLRHCPDPEWPQVGDTVIAADWQGGVAAPLRFGEIAGTARGAGNSIELTARALCADPPAGIVLVIAPPRDRGDAVAQLPREE